MEEVRESLRIFVPLSFIRKFTIAVKSNPEKYKEIERALIGARIPMTVQRLLAIGSFYSYISLIVGLIIGLLLFYFVIPVQAITSLLSKIPIFPIVYPLIKYKLYALISGLFIGLVMSKLTKYLIISYPFFVYNRRKSEIEMYLPHAVNMMYGMAVGGIPIYDIVKSIAEARHILGELSREFSIIVEHVELFKKDVLDAMRFVRDTTPSEKLSSFLDNLIFLIRGGGRISEFLRDKSEKYIEEQETTFEAFTEFMGLMAEVYISVFVLLPLFLLITFVVMKLIGQEMLTLYRNSIAIVLPVASVMFIWLIRSVIPMPKVKLEEIEERYEILRANVSETLKNTFSIDRMKRLKKKIVKFLLHPFKTDLYAIQLRIIVFHLSIVALIVFLTCYRFLSLNLTAIISISCFLIPVIAIIELKERTIRKAEERIPEMFSELAMLNEAGLSIFEALKVLSATEMGILTKEIRILRREVEWGVLLPRAFVRFGLRLKSDILSKAIPAIIKALETSPTIKDAFAAVASYTDSEIRFRKRLRSSMFLYVVIIYITIFVFLFVSYTIIKNFLAAFSGLNVTSVGGFVVMVDVSFIKEIFFETTIIVALLSGIIAGVIGEGKITAGIKHSYIFLIASYIMYTYFI